MSPPSNESTQPTISSQTSKLLDLPVEMFQLIMNRVIRDVPLGQAWRMRSVCKTFQQYIEHHIRTYTPIKSFKDQDKTSNIIFDHMDKFLMKRCLDPVNLPKNPVPYFLVRLADKLLQDFLPKDAEKNYEDFRENYLIELIQMALRGDGKRRVFCTSYDWDECVSVTEWWKLPAMNTDKDPELEDHEVLVAAAVVGNLPAVGYYLSKDKSHKILYSGGCIFGPALSIATDNNKLDVVALLLEHCKGILKQIEGQSDNDCNNHRSEIRQQLRWAIRKAMTKQNLQVLEALLSFEIEHIGYNTSRVGDLISDAIGTGCLELLGLVCSFKRKEDNPSDHESWWKKACQGSNLELVRYLLENGVVKTGPEDSHYLADQTLEWVAESGQGKIATLLIEHGAGIDCRNSKNFKEAWEFGGPLKTAAYFDNIEVLEILVKAGAKPHEGNPLSAVYGCKRRNGDLYPAARILIDHGSPITRRVAWGIEVEAKALVVSGDRWLKEKSWLDNVMAIVAGAAKLKKSVPRYRLPYVDFTLRSSIVRDIADDEDRYWKPNLWNVHARDKLWPDMYFTVRVLENVVNRRIKFAKEHRHLVDDAREALVWLLDLRI